jgi:CRP-like cAMP-binding protein
VTSTRRASVYRLQADRLLEAHPNVDVAVDDLVGILQRCSVRVVQRGRVVCREGDMGLELYFLLRGSIAILKRDLEGKQRPVGEVEAPTLLGQMGVIDRARRAATCVAASEVILAVMGQAVFQRLVRATDGQGRALRRVLLSSLTHQLVRGNARMRDLLAARLDPAAAGRAGLGEAFLQASGLVEGWAGTAAPSETSHASST